MENGVNISKINMHKTGDLRVPFFMVRPAGGREAPAYSIAKSPNHCKFPVRDKSTPARRKTS
jgi:hypothetical protein